MRIPSHINKLIFEKRIFHLITGSRVTVEKGGLLQIGKNIKIKKSKIYVQKGDKLIIGDNTAICNTSISMITGKENQLYIGKHCRIQDYNIGLTN